MTNYKIRLVIAIAFVISPITLPYAQEASSGQPSGQASSLHTLMIGFVRTVNTAELKYHTEHHSYATWQMLVENQETHRYLTDWLVQFYPQFNAPVSKMNFEPAPAVLPGLNLRVNVAPDRGSYIVLVEDLGDKTGLAFVSDERGVIRYCQFIR